MIRISAPWSAQPWLGLAGDHPLPATLIADGDGVEFETGVVEPTAARIRHCLERAADLGRQLLSYGTEVEVERFLYTRGVEAQAQIPDNTTGLFVHTSPTTIGDRPFALHIEEAGSLYRYLLPAGDPEVDVMSSAYRRMLRHLLESDACRLIATHLHSTVECVDSMFGSERINRKVAYIPLGVDYAELPPRTKTRGGANFLFTNSHGWDLNFLIRGGMETVAAFCRFYDTHPDSRLTIVGPIPELVRDRVLNAAAATPGLHLAGHVDDSTMLDLYAAADAFLMPSLCLHSYSLLRAMACGTVPVVGQAPGYEEFVQDRQTALLVQRSIDRSWYDPKTRLMKRSALVDSNRTVQFDDHLCEEIHSAMTWLVQHPSEREAMSDRGRRYVLDNHRVEPWRHQFRELIRDRIQS
jgi:glycosyltransferase involved in cell wall biosynthesis